MCPCPICAMIAFVLLPFAGYKWAKKFINKHHNSCGACQQAEHNQNMKKHIKCRCNRCTKK